jgi:DNA-binding NarL/FixJ family response regulator
MKSFFIVDNNPIFRYGLKALINSFDNCKVVADENDLNNLFLDNFPKGKNLFFLNLDDKETDAMQLVKKVKDFDCTARVIGFSRFRNKEELMKIVKSGINGLLIQTCEPEELQNAISMVYQGQDYFARPVVELIIKSYAKSNPEIKELMREEQFSKREIEIIKLICQQKTAKEIGKIIFVCEKTVDFHRNKIIDKMNVRNIIGLVVYAIKNELVKVDEI